MKVENIAVNHILVTNAFHTFIGKNWYTIVKFLLQIPILVRFWSF